MTRPAQSRPAMGERTYDRARPPPRGRAMSLADELQKLESLRANGALTHDEYALAKARVLNGQPGPAAPPAVQPVARPAGGDNWFKRFRRSTKDSVIGGVCGGLGEATP